MVSNKFRLYTFVLLEPESKFLGDYENLVHVGDCEKLVGDYHP